MHVSDLPELSSEYPVSQETMDAFQRDGHTCLKSVASREEVAVYREAIRAAADAHGQQGAKPLEQRDTYGKAFLKHMNLWAHDDAVRKFATSRRFGRIAADLLQVDGVRIYHDQALFKEPGGGITPWHQDQYYWPVDTDNTVTMWMPLVDLTADMGMLTFASRSHRDGYLGTLPISDESEEVFQKYIEDKGMEICRQDALGAGDATFHRGWNLHSAPGNHGDRMREVYTVIWVADGCRVTEPINDNQKRGMERWMPGLRPGDRVAGELNPLTYSRKKA